MLIILLIFIIFFILIIPITIELEYKSRGEDDRFVLNIFTILGIPGLSIRLPYINNKFINMFSEFFLEIDTFFSSIIPGKGEIDLEKEVEYQQVHINKIKKVISFMADREFEEMLFHSLKIKNKKFYWKTDFGLSNPALTGISTGFIWILKGMLFSFFTNRINFNNEPEIAVCPDFYNRYFQTTIRGIFSMFVGNIIVTVFKVFLYKLKGGSGKWENIQLKN